MARVAGHVECRPSICPPSLRGHRAGRQSHACRSRRPATVQYAPTYPSTKVHGSLTLPSSGQPPGYRGLPLMSNVRHRKAPVLQDRALKAKSSMPFKRSLTISRQLNGCELVVEAKHWQNIEQAQCRVATPCNVHAHGGNATKLDPRPSRPPVPQAGGRLTHLAARKRRPIQVARSVPRQAHCSPT